MKYLRLFLQFAKICFIGQIAYRPSFFLAILGKVIRIGILIIFFRAIFFGAETLVHWQSNQILVLIATFATIEFLYGITFHRNLLYYFPNSLREGSFDFLLVKPVNILFYTSFRVVDFFDLFSFISILFLWYHIFFISELSFTFSGIFLYFLLLINSLIFIFALTLLISSTAFWTMTTSGLGRFFENIMKLAKYPTDIFSEISRVFFFWILPIAIIATIPAKTLLETIQIKSLIFAFGFTIVLLLLSLKFWRFSLKYYSSASS